MRRKCRCGLYASPYDGLCIGCWCEALLLPKVRCESDGCQREIMQGARACIAHCGLRVVDIFKSELQAARTAYELEWILAELDHLKSATRIIEALKPYIDDTRARVGDVHMSLDGDPIAPYETGWVDPATYKAYEVSE